MKNMYFGDVGDFAKYGLLLAFAESNLKIGVNWYLTEDEVEVSDGRFIEYLKENRVNNELYAKCDEHLYLHLRDCVDGGNRNIIKIEKYMRFSNYKFYNELLSVDGITGLSEKGRMERVERRDNWFRRSIDELSCCDVIFCDPDNGIMPQSVRKTKKNSVKFVHWDEIEYIYNTGKSVIIYQHKARISEEIYIEKFRELSKKLKNSKLRVFRFPKYGVRYFIIFIKEEHEKDIEESFKKITCSNWNGILTPMNII